MSELKRHLIKWAICCGAIIVLYLVFGDIGLLFSVGFDYVIIKYM